MQGAFETGVYPNRFAAFGHDDAAVRRKLEETFQTMFYGRRTGASTTLSGTTWATWRTPATTTPAPRA